MNGGTGAQPVLAVGADGAKERMGQGLQIFHDSALGVFEPAHVKGRNALAGFVGADGTIFVVPAVGRAIGRGHIEFDQVNVLADDVGWRFHLVIVQLVDAGDQVGVPELDTVTAVEAHDQGFGRFFAIEHGCHVFPKGLEALLREVPADFVNGHVSLDDGRPVVAGLGNDRTVVGPAGIGVGRARFGGQAVSFKLGDSAVGFEGGLPSPGVERHG